MKQSEVASRADDGKPPLPPDLDAILNGSGRQPHFPIPDDFPPRPFWDYPGTDLGAADLFAARHGTNLRFVYGQGWLTWDGTAWRKDADGAVQRTFSDMARECLREAADIDTEGTRKAAIDIAKRLQGRNVAQNALALAESFAGIATKVSDLDADPYLFGVANGVVDLRTGVFRAGNRSDLVTRRSPVHYDPAADCPRWKRFLGEIMLGDESLVRYLHRAAGYSLTGDMREQVFFFSFGGGSNGKTVLLETLQAVLGEYSARASSSLLVTGATAYTRDPRNELAELPGVRFLTAPEVDEKCRLNEAIVKDITGGDTLRAEAKYERGFRFRPQSKVWLFGNHKPTIGGTDRGIWRRVRLIPFNASFEGREDKRLTETLAGELPGILNWLIAGAKDWAASGLGETPLAVSSALVDYQSAEDWLGAFIRDCTRPHGDAIVRKRAVYERYRAWADENGYRHPLTSHALTKTLKGRGWHDGGGTDYWRGWTVAEGNADEGLHN